MLAQNSSIVHNTTTEDGGLANGLAHQCNGRGTLDIMQICAITIFLCSWSVLCLNTPEWTASGRWAYLKNKLQWLTLAVFFPEVITAIGAEQWASALQCVEDMEKLGYKEWTIRHAFFANMGELMLETPDFPKFPVDGQQLEYLLQKKYLPFPTVAEKQFGTRTKRILSREQ